MQKDDFLNAPIRPNPGVGTSLDLLDVDVLKERLPEELSAKSRSVIQETAPIIAGKADAIAKVFYRRLLEGHLELVEFFNATNQKTNKQPRALAAALIAFAADVGDMESLEPALEVMSVKHCAMNVLPHHYFLVHENLMVALEDVAGQSLTLETHAAWSEALLFLTRALIEKEEQLYRKARSRRGGWRGFREFVVVRKERETPDVATLTLRPLDAWDRSFDFSPGQFLTLKVDPHGDGLTAPRHYTVTSPPGMPYLQISVKKLKGGKVSTYLHDKVKEGANVLVSPPFGVFTAPLSESSTVVLLSAGIGITPMLALFQELGPRVKMVAHVDKTEDMHPFRQRFAGSDCQVQVHYTRREGRPPRDLAAKLAKAVGTDHHWFICGPSSFMCDAMRSLVGAGVAADHIHHEAFAPQLCPAVWHELGG